MTDGFDILNLPPPTPPQPIMKALFQKVVDSTYTPLSSVCREAVKTRGARGFSFPPRRVEAEGDATGREPPPQGVMPRIRPDTAFHGMFRPLRPAPRRPCGSKIPSLYPAVFLNVAQKSPLRGS